MCEPHNKAKGTLPLEDFRVRLKMRDFFQESRDVTLHDLLKYFMEKEHGFTFGNPEHGKRIWGCRDTERLGLRQAI